MRFRGRAIADVDGAVDYLQSFGCVRFAAPPPRILFPRGGVYIKQRTEEGTLGTPGRKWDRKQAERVGDSEN